MGSKRAGVCGGRFVLSLDFEMYWGIRDLFPLSFYREQLSRERAVVRKLLALFSEYGIACTWAVVGFLFAESPEELADALPDLRPGYREANLSPYPYIASGQLRDGDKAAPGHFAFELIREIGRTPRQRVSTHTLSHYYCLEEGQTIEEFREDLKAAIRLAGKKRFRLESIVFPRNQCNPAYLGVLKELGIRSYRGNPRHRIYRNGWSGRDAPWKRAIRLLDAYFNLTGHHCYAVEACPADVPVNVPASHFMRPYCRLLGWLEPLRVRRILRSMTYAARRGLVYHLWWHPYNFSRDEDKNMDALKRVLSHYQKLHREYGMQSLNMEELSDQILERTAGRTAATGKNASVRQREEKT